MDPLIKPSESSITDPDPIVHPVRAFLHECGIDVTQFPRLRLLVEVRNATKLRGGQLYLPLRIPRAKGFAYESYCRVTRVLEIPSASAPKEHRRFFELEWTVGEHPIPDEEDHTAFSFLAREMDCPSCKHIFIPEIEVLDKTSVRIVCPQCIHHWVLKIEAPHQEKIQVRSLLDAFRDNPSQMRKEIQEWNLLGPQSPGGSEFFPFHFAKWDEASSSLEWLFDDTYGWTASSKTDDIEFEVLAKAMINAIALEYFLHSRSATDNSILENTDVQRRSEIRRRNQIQREVVEDLFPTQTSVRLDPIRLAREKALSPTKKLLVTACATAAALVLVLGAFIFHPQFMHKNSQVYKVPSSVSKALLSKVGTAVTPATTKSALSRQDIERAAEAKVEAERAEADAAENANRLTDEEVKTITNKQISTLNAEKLKEAQKAKEIEADEKKRAAERETAALQKQKAAKIETTFREGMLHLKLQQSKEAIGAFKRVLDLDPNNAASYRGLGLAYVYDQKFDQAIQAFEQYLKVSKNSFDRESILELLRTLKDRTKNSVAKQ